MGGTHGLVQNRWHMLRLDRHQGIAQRRVRHSARDVKPPPHLEGYLLGDVFDLAQPLGSSCEADQRGPQQRPQLPALASWVSGVRDVIEVKLSQAFSQESRHPAPES